MKNCKEGTENDRTDRSSDSSARARGFNQGRSVASSEISVLVECGCVAESFEGITVSVETCPICIRKAPWLGEGSEGQLSLEV